MTSNHLFTGRNLVIAGMALSVVMIAGKEAVIPSSALPSSQTVLSGDSKAGRALSRAELLPLEAVAGRVQSMMSEVAFTSTRVWPHGVRDQQGRIGIFLSSERPLFNDSTPAISQAKEDWVVIGLVAAVKYSEGSQIRHIAFTDSRGETGERWYYDLSMAEAREIHEMMIRGVLRPENAYKLIEARWQKVTPQHKYAVN
jgi:flagellar motor protein MotB